MDGPAAHETEFLRAMARQYVWDQTEAEALASRKRTIRRVMDLGVWEDVLTMEQVIGRASLIEALRSSPPGAPCEAKDCSDIAALLRSGLKLERGLGAAAALFPDFPPPEALRALVYFKPSELDGLSRTDRQTLVEHVDRAGAPIPLAILSKRLAS